MHLFGLVEYLPNPPAGQTTRTVNWERFTQFINSPGQIADDVYQWSSAFDATTFLQRLADLMTASGLPGGMYPQPDSTKAVLGNTSTGLSELRFPLFQKGFTQATYSQFGITFSPPTHREGKPKALPFCPTSWGQRIFSSMSVTADSSRSNRAPTSKESAW